MKIAATEALWETCDDCAFSLFQIGGFTTEDETPSFDIEIPYLLSFLATGSFTGTVQGMNPLESSYQDEYGSGNYKPAVETTYWSMRTMAYLGTFVFLVLALGGYYYRRRKLEAKTWFLKVAVWTIPLPYIAALAGWMLSEVGRQPWIVQGLLETADANSPSVSSSMIWLSLGTIVVLYVSLLVVDYLLMRRYARLDPPEVGGEGDEFSLPAVTY
jgi:cytochrome d ubiquinol oxidase subunit I